MDLKSGAIMITDYLEIRDLKDNEVARESGERLAR